MPGIALNTSYTEPLQGRRCDFNMLLVTSFEVLPRDPSSLFRNLQYWSELPLRAGEELQH